MLDQAFIYTYWVILIVIFVLRNEPKYPRGPGNPKEQRARPRRSSTRLRPVKK